MTAYTRKLDGVHAIKFLEPWVLKRISKIAARIKKIRESLAMNRIKKERTKGTCKKVHAEVESVFLSFKRRFFMKKMGGRKKLKGRALGGRGKKKGFCFFFWLEKQKNVREKWSKAWFAFFFVGKLLEKRKGAWTVFFRQPRSEGEREVYCLNLFFCSQQSKELWCLVLPISGRQERR